MQLKTFSAKLRKTRSGDDFMMVLDIGLAGIEISSRVRLKDVKAPNPNAGEPQAEELRDRVNGLLVSSTSVVVEVLREHTVGVVVGKVYYVKQDDPTGAYTCLNDELIKMGYEYRA